MAKEGVHLVSVTNHFKFEAPDGKQRAADALDAECVQILAKHYHDPDVIGIIFKSTNFSQEKSSDILFFKKFAISLYRLM